MISATTTESPPRGDPTPESPPRGESHRPRLRDPSEWRKALTVEQLDYLARKIIKNAPARGVPDMDLDFFLARCQALNLDPFDGHILGIYRDQKGTPVMAIQTTVEGYGVVAERTGLLVSISEPAYDCIPVPDAEGSIPQHPHWCRVVVTRLVTDRFGRVLVDDEGHQRTREVAYTAYWSDFNQGPATAWGQYKWHQLGVRAEGHALKRAFRTELAGMGIAGPSEDGEVIDTTAVVRPTVEEPAMPPTPSPRLALPQGAPAELLDPNHGLQARRVAEPLPARR